MIDFLKKINKFFNYMDTHKRPAQIAISITGVVAYIIMLSFDKYVLEIIHEQTVIKFLIGTIGVMLIFAIKELFNYMILKETYSERELTKVWKEIVIDGLYAITALGLLIAIAIYYTYKYVHYLIKWLNPFQYFRPWEIKILDGLAVVLSVLISIWIAHLINFIVNKIRTTASKQVAKREKDDEAKKKASKECEEYLNKERIKEEKVYITKQLEKIQKNIKNNTNEKK